jgi:hypothetical protein
VARSNHGAASRRQVACRRRRPPLRRALRNIIEAIMRSGVLARNSGGLLLIVTAQVMMAGGCKRKHVSVDAVPEVGYPTCGDAAADVRTPVESGKLRSGPYSTEKSVVETFAIERTGCGYVFTGRQEWPLGTADYEVVYDENLTPLRVWKRMTIPGTEDGRPDIRRYELRSPEVSIKRRTPDGEVFYELLKAGGKLAIPPRARVGAVIGPGRGLLTMWIRRAKLAQGAKVRELVLDFREAVETLEMASLQREEDLFEPTMGKTVRVYTFYGRESVFADENDSVIGDLAGLRRSESLATPEPEAMPRYGEPDPIHTP